jgi:hypothetical protein
MTEYLEAELLEKILSAKGDLQKIVDAPFTTMTSVILELGAVVLLFENKKTKTIDRIVLSKTEPAAGAVRSSRKPFNEIKIPLSCKENAIVRALKTGKNQTVADWKFLFAPELNSQEARDNQHGAGILCSVVAPLTSRKKRGAIIYSFLCPELDIRTAHHDFINIFTEIVSKEI